VKYEAIDWDDDWAELVDPYVEAWENEKPTTRLEEKYDRRLVESASCRLYAERLLENLRKQNDSLSFAAHTDATGWPPNSYWRIVVRKANGKPVSDEQLGKLKRAAKAILRNIEAKYPDIGAKTQEDARTAAEKRMKAEYREMGIGIAFAREKREKRGCLWSVFRLFWPF
jgi:hypothetical protein